MAPARARGCAAQASQLAGRLHRQADASRRQNGPRKATSRRPITVRLRSKSCPTGRSDVSRVGRRAVVAHDAATPSAGGGGVEDQVGRAGAAYRRGAGSAPRRGGLGGSSLLGASTDRGAGSAPRRGGLGGSSP